MMGNRIISIIKTKYDYVKYFLSIILLLILVIKIQPKKIFSVLINTDLCLLGIALLFVPMVYILKTIKWQVFLKSQNININFMNALRALLIGTAYGIVTPGKFGELMRAFYLSGDKLKSIPTIIWDKIVDIFTLIILSVLATFIFFNNYTVLFILIFIATLLVFLIFFVINEKVISFLANLFNISKNSKETYLLGMNNILDCKIILFKAFSLALIYYIICFAMATFLLKSLNSNANIILVFSLPIIVLLGNAPITISGLGLREFVTVICFNILGEKSTIGFSFSILIFVMITLMPGLIGSLLMLEKGARKIPVGETWNKLL